MVLSFGSTIGPIYHSGGNLLTRGENHYEETLHLTPDWSGLVIPGGQLFGVPFLLIQSKVD